MVELPVVCGRSSLEPEVAASGFSLLDRIETVIDLLRFDKIFSKNTVVKNTIPESTSDKTDCYINQTIGEKNGEENLGRIKRIKRRI